MRSISSWVFGGVILFCLFMAFILQKMDDVVAACFIAVAGACLASGWRSEP